ncbi:unnamed protein product (macronuclear) [Paramecium tetraurelia]|uniref:Reverse transcriptase domain-containing protein n=1 Tax=Paramecium tetraurelia TaxID=5888 RepID=A0CW26_PARTE|nr:uncharacterized protein GSPATT00001195001 [Paramecium tetraurelia]CAK74993.1 unnamed protein product [Paramecium tetraurelia]|eukprot:XP_001442390.1 hypothetical protein (macronuclear) [Paramecium tetraurelia strain d4-2]
MNTQSNIRYGDDIVVIIQHDKTRNSQINLDKQPKRIRYGQTKEIWNNESYSNQMK